MEHKDLDLLRENDAFGIQLAKRFGASSMLANHYHNHYEIFYLLSGERYYFIHDRTYHIKKGDLVIINDNILHRTIDANNSGHERILVNFRKSFLIDSPDIDLLSFMQLPSTVIRLDSEQQAEVEKILYKMIYENTHCIQGYITYLKILLTELLLYINRLPRNEQSSNFDPSPLHSKFSEVVRYINCHYFENLSSDLVAKHFYMSRYYFCHKFKETTGFTFTQYVNTVRIKEAQRLLQSTNDNISEIAFKVGFDSPTHFSRTFKSITKLTPGQFRKS